MKSMVIRQQNCQPLATSERENASASYSAWEHKTARLGNHGAPPGDLHSDRRCRQAYPVQWGQWGMKAIQTDIARLSVVRATPVIGACGLCATEPAELTAAVVVRHVRGGSVRFAACGRCTLATRRVIAAIGGHGDVTATPEHAALVTPLTPRSLPVGEAVLVREYPDGLRDTAGTRYAIRVYGAPRADGTWIGWIEFVTADVGAVLRTAHETTQSNLDHLVYWAGGLEPAYFQGAFSRAR